MSKRWDRLRITQPKQLPIGLGKWYTSGSTKVELMSIWGEDITVSIGDGNTEFSLKAKSMIELGEFLVELGKQASEENHED